MNLGLETTIAQNAARQYNITGASQKRSAERLSSGYRINRAADDAAGLKISEKMRSQIRGLDKASSDITDGLSYVQVADGALAEIQSMLHRINELSVQSSNDTNTASDRLAIDNEVQALKKEVNRIFSDTEFNGLKIWDGIGNHQVQVGTAPVAAVTSGCTSSTQLFILTEDNKWKIPSDNQYNVSASEADGIKISWTAYNGQTYSTKNIPWPAGDIAGQTIDFRLGDYLDTDTYPDLKGSGINFRVNYQVSGVSTLQDVIDSINGTSITMYPYVPTKVNLFKTDGTPLNNYYSKNGISANFSCYIDYTAQLASDRKFDGTEDTTFIEPSISQPDNFHYPSPDSSPWSLPFTLGQNALHPDAMATTNGTFDSTATSNSTYYYGYSNEPNNPSHWWYTDQYGTHSIIHTVNNNCNGTPSSIEDALLNGDSSNLALNTTQYGGFIVLSIPISGSYDVKGTGYNGQFGAITMTLNVNNDTTLDDIKDLLTDIGSVDISSESYANCQGGYVPVNTITLEEPVFESEMNLNIQTSDVAYDHISLAYKSLRLDNLGLESTNTQTYQDSQDAIGACANDLEIVSSQRSLFGSYQNRLEAAHSIAENTKENTQNAESKLRDTDMAQEMVSYSANSILSQAQEAMMAQSNSRLSQVLSLLQMK